MQIEKFSGRITRSERGTSLAEVLVTIGIVTTILGVGILGLNRGYLNLTAAKQNLVNDLRQARMQATLKGTHFRFEAMGNKYSIQRLAKSETNGAWSLDPSFAPKVVDLPPGFTITVNSASPAPIAEFDGRGLLVPFSTGSPGIVTVVIIDSKGKTEQIQIWPSGQVEDAVAPHAG